RNHGPVMAGVIYEDVHPAEFLPGGGHHALTIGFAPHICRTVPYRPALGDNLLGCRSQFRFRARCEEDACAFTCKDLGGGAPNAASGGGNQGNFVVEQHHVETIPALAPAVPLSDIRGRNFICAAHSSV